MVGLVHRPRSAHRHRSGVNLSHRPPTPLRAFVALIGLAAIGTNAALLLSDRAPRLLRSLFGDTVVRLTERLDAGGRSDAVLAARDIGGDSIVHFGLWATATVIIGVAIWTWWGLIVAAGSIGALSLLIEVGQGRYSSSRAVERSDALFNLLGVASGCVLVAAIYTVGEATGRLAANVSKSIQTP